MTHVEDDHELAHAIVRECQDPRARAALAGAMGEADIISQRLPVGAIPAVVRAAWMQLAYVGVENHLDPIAPTLRFAALALLEEAVATMEPLLGVVSPDDLAGLADN